MDLKKMTWADDTENKEATENTNDLYFKITHLITENKTLTQQKQDLKEALSTSKNESLNLAKDIANIKNVLAHSINESENKINQLDLQIIKHKEKTSQKDKEISFLKTQINQSFHEIETIEEEMRAVAKKAHDEKSVLSTQVLELSIEIEKKEHLFLTEQSKNAYLQTLNLEFSQELQELRDTTEKKIQQQQAAHQLEKIEWMLKLDLLKEMNEKKVLESESLLETLHNQVKELTIVSKQLSESTEGRQLENNQLQVENKKLEKMLLEAQRQITLLAQSTDHTELAQQNAILLKNQMKQDDLIKVKEDELFQLKLELVTTQESLKQLIESKENLKSSLNEKITFLENQLKIGLAEKEKSMQHSAISVQRIKEKEDEIFQVKFELVKVQESLKNQIESKNNIRLFMNEKIAFLENSLQQLTATKQATEFESNQLQSENKKLDQKLYEAKNQIAVLSASTHHLGVENKLTAERSQEVSALHAKHSDQLLSLLKLEVIKEENRNAQQTTYTQALKQSLTEIVTPLSQSMARLAEQTQNKNTLLADFESTSHKGEINETNSAAIVKNWMLKKV